MVYHCLCVFTGGWKVPEGVEPNVAYWWLGKLISGFRIESIAFVGGYVMAYQMIARQRDRRLLPFVWKKVKRLIVPCVVFGFAFWMLFRYNGHWDWRNMTFRLLGGVAHLWFLPMLFWCFLAMWPIARWLRPERHWGAALALLAVLAVVSVLPNPKGMHFGLTQVNHFLFFFYGGYLTWSATNRVALRHRGMAAALLAAGYVLLLVARLKVGLPNHWNIWVMRSLRWGHICCGIMALYLAVREYLARKEASMAEGGYEPKPWVLWCSGMCYGVYVIHYFILWALYYYTPMPQLIASWLLPWAALTATLAGSVAGAWLLKKCKINII